jgi:hypothetical protein
MKSRLRYLFLALFLGLLLMAALLFRQFVVAGILLPAATAVWLVLRIFVLSIHQQLFWWGVIFLSVIVAFRGLYPGSAIDPRLPALDSNPARDRVGSLRESILLNVRAAGGKDSFRRDLMWLFTTLYSTRHQGEAKYQIRDAILEHRIPIPESIFTFLFFTPRPAPRLSFLRHPVERLKLKVDSSVRAIQKRVRRRTGRETSDYLRAIDEVLTFMETSLEMREEYDTPEVHRIS